MICLCYWFVSTLSCFPIPIVIGNCFNSSTDHPLNKYSSPFSAVQVVQVHCSMKWKMPPSPLGYFHFTMHDVWLYVYACIVSLFATFPNCISSLNHIFCIDLNKTSLIALFIRFVYPLWSNILQVLHCLELFLVSNACMHFI